jgi:hypothetical protein
MIFLHPELCIRPTELAQALCHELAHYTRGFEYEHDEVFVLEMRELNRIYGRKIEAAVIGTVRHAV